MATWETSKPLYCTVALNISVQIFQLNSNSELAKLYVINLNKYKSICIDKF